MNMDHPVEEMETEGACAVIAPLAFPGPASRINEVKYFPWEAGVCQCLLCTRIFQIPRQKENLIAHLYGEHSVILAHSERIACFIEYIDYWRARLQKDTIDNFTTLVIMENLPYHMFSDAFPEDMQLRNSLLKKRLEWVLDCQIEEREDRSFTKRCFFCRHVEKGSRYKFVTHLSYQHNFRIGKPENIVFIDRLLEKVEERLNRLECVYCKHVFKDRSILKEHMRKKFHKRINPYSKEFDPFYIVYYLQEHNRRPREEYQDDSWAQWREEGTDWSDWKDDPTPIVCLFCTRTFTDWEDIMEHMHKEHRFDYKLYTTKCNFYDQVKMVNFIRRAVHMSECYSCKMKFQSREELLTHMNMSDHFTPPNRRDWDHPEFFFSTYDNDIFLTLLEDIEEDPLDQLSSELGSGFSLK